MAAAVVTDNPDTVATLDYSRPLVVLLLLSLLLLLLLVYFNAYGTKAARTAEVTPS